MMPYTYPITFYTVAQRVCQHKYVMDTGCRYVCRYCGHRMEMYVLSSTDKFEAVR